MTLDELFEEIESNIEEAIKAKKASAEHKMWENESYHDGKIMAFRICLEKLREYRRSSASGI